jgi:hypothetical protein
MAAVVNVFLLFVPILLQYIDTLPKHIDFVNY